jgi:two-component system, cell cycle response regulator
MRERMNQNADSNTNSLPPVLVIDDSPDVHRLLRVQLKHEDLELVSASTGEEGLIKAHEVQPAMILLDLDMPGLDGFEVLVQLKNDPELMHVPVIVLSGLASAQDKVAAFDLGAVDYITKPFNLTELRVRVRSALRMHHLVRMLAQRARIDGLTGLWNRAYFDKRWTDEVAASSRHGRSLSLAMLDVDNFKSINDDFGHPTGDVVLQGLAKIMMRESRQEDVACRYGGEEFALIMPDTSTAEAVKVCERIARATRTATWPGLSGRTVTLSCGVAGCGGSGHLPAHQWLALADEYLYNAKSSGRNQIVWGAAPGLRIAC